VPRGRPPRRLRVTLAAASPFRGAC
jgi:hypothetical protein